MANSTSYRRSNHPAPSSEIALERKTMLCGNMSFAATEAYKLLRTNVMFSFADDKRCHLIGVTSAMPGEGKSLTAINLAYSLAELNKRVLLIDADLRIPSIAQKLSLAPAPGLSNLLVEAGDVTEAIQHYSSRANDTRFDILPAGNIPPNPSELLGSDRMVKLMELLAQHYDYILFDLPPTVSVTDVLVVSRLTHGMLMVVRQDYCQRAVLMDAVKQLEFVDAKILGFVLNCATDSPSGYSGSYKRYAGKRYSKYYGYNKKP